MNKVFNVISKFMALSCIVAGCFGHVHQFYVAVIFLILVAATKESKEKCYI